ncbi:DNA starvation/stationary phase protection protein [Streptomyces] [Streptomyces griseus]
MVKSTLSEGDLKVVGTALQGALVDLVDLSLVAKQVHWNVVGPRFRSVHLQLDEVVVTARQHSDTVAERASAVGVNPDGRSGTVAKETAIASVPEGWIGRRRRADPGGRAGRGHRPDAGAHRGDRRAGSNAQDLLIGLTAELEKHAWMFQAESA